MPVQFSFFRKFAYIKRLFALLLAIALLSGVVAVCPQSAAALEKVSDVRVLLTALQAESGLEIGIYGSYQLNDAISFQRGSRLKVSVVDNSLKMSYEGMAYYPGGSLKLTRYNAPQGEENGLRFNGQLSLYEGSLVLTVEQGRLVPILTLPVEAYLKGVVPYEMADEFPLEALKAQAVAARTYTLAHLKPDDRYDLVDNTNDQVYRGLNPDKENAIAAVEQTAGMVGTYQGRLVNAYYTASNGGFTESAYNAWGREKIPYLQIQEDRYDLENPASIVKSIRVAKTADNAAEPGKALYGRLQAVLEARLESLGLDPEKSEIRLLGIEGITPHTSRYGGEAGVMKNLRFDLQTEVTSEVPVDPDEEISLASQSGSTGTVSETQEFQTVKSTRQVAVDLPIFPDVEQLLSLSINRYENEIFSIIEESEHFLVQSRRYGHGVGMSQRGAEWMAGQYNWDFMQILRFYYPGIELVKYDTEPGALPDLALSFLTTPGPVPTATPRPTLMPQTEQAGLDQRVVYVTEVAQNSSLNLRARPDYLADIITRLYYGQRLLVIQATEDGWLEVRTDAVQGFVRHEYISDNAPVSP